MHSRMIHILWDSPLTEAPLQVRVAVNLWQHLNPAWQVRLYSIRDLQRELHAWPTHILDANIQAQSDALRIELLAKHGGVWTDASVLPTRPLDAWIHEQVDATGFFAFRLVAMDRPLASWFLASDASCLLTQHWRNMCIKYWLSPHSNSVANSSFQKQALLDPISALCSSLLNADQQYPYFWFHYLFDMTCYSYPEVALIWRRSPRPRAAQCLRPSHLWKQKEYEAAAACLLETRAPVVKLNWRHNWNSDVLEAFASAVVQT